MSIRVLIAGLAYFAMVFAAGFALGVFRVMVMVPAFGEGTSELIELPFMVAISYAAARFTVRRFEISKSITAFALGLIAFVLLVGFELILVLGLRGRSFSEYLDSRDPVAFAAYLLSLLIFALIPLGIVHYLNRRDMNTSA